MTLGLEQGQRCIDKEPAKITAPSSTMLELMLTILLQEEESVNRHALFLRSDENLFAAV